MAAIAASARAAHLDAASEALLVSSPAISAYLQAQRTTPTTTSNNSISKIQACLSCGTLLITGWNANPIRASKRIRQDRLVKQDATSARKIKCSTCGKAQDMPFKVSKNTSIKKSTPRPAAHSKLQHKPLNSSPNPAPTPPVSAAIEPAAPPSSTTPAEESTHPSSNKKRSRNKKSTNNLQAMLANRKAPSAGTTSHKSAFGLGLGDFIK